MSESRKLEPHEAFDVLERIAMRDEAERIAKLDEAGLARELAGAGRTLEGERAKGKALLEKLEGRATAAVAVTVAEPVPSEPRTTSGFRSRSGSRWSASTHGGRRPTLVWLLAAALFMALAVAFVERQAIVARFKPEPVLIEPVPSTEKLPAPAPTPQAVALAVRHDAWLACKQMNLEVCETKLDEARKLDPAGENTQAVDAMRRFIFEKRLPPPPKDDPFGKGLGPNAPKGP
ncbi:MAG: hypothetical protein ACRENE_30835 [Polyangiaceae bacterium]